MSKKKKLNTLIKLLCSLIVLAFLTSCQMFKSENSEEARQEIEQILFEDGTRELAPVENEFIDAIASSKNKEDFYRKANEVFFDGTTGASVGEQLFLRLYIVDASNDALAEVSKKTAIKEVISGLDSIAIKAISAPANIYVVITYGGFGVLPFEKDAILGHIKIIDANENIIAESQSAVTIKPKELKLKDLEIHFSSSIPLFQLPGNMPAGKYFVIADLSSPTTNKILKLKSEIEIKEAPAQKKN